MTDRRTGARVVRGPGVCSEVAPEGRWAVGAYADGVRGRLPRGGGWRVWCRRAPWRGCRTGRPLARLLDLLDLDIDPISVLCLLIALPLLVVMAAEQVLRLVLTPVAVLVRALFGLPWPVEIAYGRFGRRESSLVLVDGYATAARVRDAVAGRLASGAPLADPAFQQWLSEVGAMFLPTRPRGTLRRLYRASRQLAGSRR